MICPYSLFLTFAMALAAGSLANDHQWLPALFFFLMGVAILLFGHFNRDL